MVDQALLDKYKVGESRVDILYDFMLIGLLSHKRVNRC